MLCFTTRTNLAHDVGGGRVGSTSIQIRCSVHQLLIEFHIMNGSGDR